MVFGSFYDMFISSSLLVGAGGNTRKLHIPLLQAIPAVSIVAVCNRSVQSGSEVAKQVRFFILILLVVLVLTSMVR